MIRGIVHHLRHAMQHCPRLRSRPALRQGCGAVLLAVLAASVQAAEPAGKGNFGKGKPNGPLLSRAELRECLATQERVRVLGEGVVAAQAAMDKEKAEIAQASAALAEQLAALDRTSAEAVDGYNAKVQTHDRRIDAYNTQTPVFNGKIETLQGARKQFAKACENRDFDEKDEIAIRKGQ